MARKRGGSRAASSAVSKRNSAPKPGAKPGATPDRARVIDAFMSLVAEKPMEDIGLAEIASQAGVSLADLRAMFGSTFDILAAHVRQIDVEVLAGADADMAEELPRERLFDVLMRRIELLEPRKDGRALADALVQAQSRLGFGAQPPCGALATMDADRGRHSCAWPAGCGARAGTCAPLCVGAARLGARR